MPHTLTFYVGNPTALALRIEIRQKISNHPRDQSLECLIPAVFFGVDCTFPAYDPPHVANAVRAQDKRRMISTSIRLHQDFLNGSHGADEARALTVRQRPKNVAGL